MATTTLDDLIEDTREKANVTRSNFVSDTAIVRLLNEAGKQLRERIVEADDSYYQGVLDFSISAAPSNLVALPADFWKVRGVDAFAGDSRRQVEIYSREFRNRFDPGVGYGFGGDGNSLAILGFEAAQCNPYRLTYTPKPIPLAPLVDGVTRSIAHNGGDGSNAGAQVIFVNGNFSAADVGGTLTIATSGSTLDGTRTIGTVVNATTITTVPPAPPSQVCGVNTVATVVGSSAHTRSFAVAPGDNVSSGWWSLQNGSFGPGDIGAFLTTDVGGTTYDGTFEIIQIATGTLVQVTPAIAGVSGPLTGTASISRQPAGTRSALDLTEDNFSEYYSVRAAMAIARKKRQDPLVAQLAIERKEIEDRITTGSKNRQGDPQSAPVLVPRRSLVGFDDLDL